MTTTAEDVDQVDALNSGSFQVMSGKSGPRSIIQ
jgi:hypothetical protein